MLFVAQLGFYVFQKINAGDEKTFKFEKSVDSAKTKRQELVDEKRGRLSQIGLRFVFAVQEAMYID